MKPNLRHGRARNYGYNLVLKSGYAWPPVGVYFLSWDWGWVKCSWESRQSESGLGTGSSQCKGPGVGVTEHREGLGVWRSCWEEMRPESEVTFMLLSPSVLFSVDTPFLHFCYGLVSFKCIWNEISNANSLVRREGLISLWFFSTEHYLWISGEGYEGFDFFFGMTTLC